MIVGEVQHFYSEFGCKMYICKSYSRWFGCLAMASGPNFQVPSLMMSFFLLHLATCSIHMLNLHNLNL